MLREFYWDLSLVIGFKAMRINEGRSRGRLVLSCKLTTSGKSIWVSLDKRKQISSHRGWRSASTWRLKNLWIQTGASSNTTTWSLYISKITLFLNESHNFNIRYIYICIWLQVPKDDNLNKYFFYCMPWNNSVTYLYPRKGSLMHWSLTKLENKFQVSQNPSREFTLKIRFLWNHF